MQFISFSASLLFGIAVGLFFYPRLLLPIIYGLPLSIYYVFKGQLGFLAIPFQLLRPLLWSIFLFVLGFVIAGDSVPQPIRDYLLNENPPFALGGWIGLVIVLWRLVTSKGRARLWADFERRTVRRFGYYDNP